ncbi:hypothetical protein [Bdellovibrio reynosensis]|uniref:Uncharacterized protein n=1 Tax=Bdellovibrio reynosensis TaxID=2835041 RepID=A0ABY4C8T2_9BACT|nr:hypothetical protein [Bdellovibrio reynosensis]UOF01403.1 hypothetical protein MNR06_00355 [Bdellovibrio reynosensis]
MGTFQVVLLTFVSIFASSYTFAGTDAHCAVKCVHHQEVDRDDDLYQECYYQCLDEQKEKTDEAGLWSQKNKPSQEENKTNQASEGKLSESKTTENVAEESASAALPCEENFDAQIAACEQESLRAGDACDENSSSLSNVSNLVSQASLYIANKSASSITESCSKMATLSKGVSAGLMAYRLYCKKGIDSCSSTCSQTLIPRCTANRVKSDLAVSAARKVMNQNKSQCMAFTRRMEEAAAAAQNYAGITMNAKDCASLTAGAGSAPTELCLTNPDYPGCRTEEKMDCSNPKMANTKVCVCSGNPNHSMCRNSTDTKESASLSLDTRLQNKKSTGFDSAQQEKLSHGERPEGDEGESIDGRQGSDIHLHSASHRSIPEKRGKTKKNISDRSVLGGFYGSAGGKKLEGNVANPLLVSEKKAVKPTNDDEKESEERNFAASDLEKFLPGNAMAPARGIAGTSERVGTDGVTGPHSDIWGKVKNRYEAVKATLLP